MQPVQSELRIATVFSGIGAVEESLKQLGVPHKILFACDNGEREPKQNLGTILKVATEVLPPSKAELLVSKLATIIFTRKIGNSTVLTDVLEEYYKIQNIEDINEKVKAIDRLAKQSFHQYGIKYSFKLQLNDLSDVANALKGQGKLKDSDIEKFVIAWYKTTKTPNYVKQSYLENYHIENDAWYEDVRFLDGKKYAGQVDFFVGGSPCQSFSTYGKKRGLEDARGTLFYDYARLVNQIRPKVFIYENVKGLLTHDKKRTWKTIQDIFHSLDYDIYPQVLNAQHYGLPQKRERIFVIGVRRDLKQTFVFPEPFELTRFAPDYLDIEVPNKYYLGRKGFEWVTNSTKNRNKTRFNRNIIGCQTANQQDNWIGDLRVEKPKPEHYADSRIYKGKYDFGNGPEDAVARKMTPEECLRLMGFVYFQSPVDDKRTYRQAGNSIAVPVLNAIIKQLQPILEYTTKK